MSDGPWTSGALTVYRHSYGRYAVQWAGSGTGTVSLVRTTYFVGGGTESVTVAGGGSLPASAPAVLIDGEAPFGEKMITLTYHAGTSTVAVDAEPRRWSVLSDPGTGLSVSLVGAELGEKVWHSDTSVSWLSVAAGGDPMVDARPEQSPTEQLVMFTTSAADEQRADVLASLRRPLLLRHPDAGTEDTWLVLVGDRARRRVTGRAGEPWRRHEWTVHRLSRQDAGRLQTGDTMADLAAVYPGTWADVVAAFPNTMADVAVHVFTAEQGVVL